MYEWTTRVLLYKRATRDLVGSNLVKQNRYICKEFAGSSANLCRRTYVVRNTQVNNLK